MSEMIEEPTEGRVTEWLENLRVDLAESVSGIALKGARPVPVGVTPGATKYPTRSPGALVGYAIRNLDTDSNVNVSVRFRDGDEDGDVILPLTLAPGESARDWFGPGGISLFEGLFMDYSRDDGQPGLIEGSVFLRGVE